MFMRKAGKIILYCLGSLMALIILVLVVSLVPINRTPVSQSEAYRQMMQRLDSLKISIPVSSEELLIGYAKENLTPAQPVSLAGYAKRRGKVYTAVLDSIYVRTMVMQLGSERIAIVSADLLIVPPTVVKVLEEKLSTIGFSLNNTYLGATHTHNSIGNWGEGVTGYFFGSYSDSIVHFIADKITASIVKAYRQMLPATVKTAAIPMDTAVSNRLNDGGPVDSLFRVLEVKRSDSSKLLFMSYTAHATCLYSRDMVLSRDYPGELVDRMEASGYTFAMFMAGAVGSHRCSPPEYGESCIHWMAETIHQKFQEEKSSLTPVDDSVLAMVRVPLALPNPRAKISKDWAIRSWLFRSAFHEYPVYLTAFRLGNVVLLGTPCDFSGELSPSLDRVADSLHLRTMITSFNGGYIGYVTPEKYYDVDHYETRIMSWYGLGVGEYLSEDMRRLLMIMSGQSK